MQHEFLQRYNRLVKTPKSVLHNIYRTLLDDSSQASFSVEAEVDECVQCSKAKEQIFVFWD